MSAAYKCDVCGVVLEGVAKQLQTTRCGELPYFGSSYHPKFRAVLRITRKQGNDAYAGEEPEAQVCPKCSKGLALRIAEGR